ncbi:MAG: tetratricopeptide repeat protein [Halofilum sp. (in: g-proteobacteria)]|nr:tetratricopeptide repeat protein [Halofilum sp. (in: g-proteobacteria)]
MPDNLHYGLALARAYRDQGRLEDALAVWEHFEAIHPASFAVVATGADLFTADGRPAAALDLLTGYLRRAPQAPPEAWRRQAEAAEAAGQHVRSHEALGEYYTRTGRFDRAMEQFQLALDGAAPGSSDALRLEARLEQVRARQRQRLADNPVSGR